jgi:hypothetical protein
VVSSIWFWTEALILKYSSSRHDELRRSASFTGASIVLITKCALGICAVIRPAGLAPVRGRF